MSAYYGFTAIGHAVTLLEPSQLAQQDYAGPDLSGAATPGVFDFPTGLVPASGRDDFSRGCLYRLA